ncbi:MAG TPA: NHL repeat-containing protein, partial [Terriglobales bacterium]
MHPSIRLAPFSRQGVKVFSSYRLFTLCVAFLFSPAAYAQLSISAYRALGQIDLRQNGINMVQGLEMHNPSGVALDGRDGALHVYVSDTLNSRVLAWQDARSYQNGDAPTLVLGQPSPQQSTALGIGVRGFSLPLGLAVDPTNGNLYVADSGNHRVLRFPNPFANPSRIEPDAVYGQPNFTSRTANSGGITSASMNRPRGVAIDSAGNLWVSDSGNHRVLRFNAAVLDSLTPEADLVIGQKDFNSGGANRGGTVSAASFDSPVGLAFDSQGNLYVADFTNARVLRFTAPFGPDAAATLVFGQSNFTSRGVPFQASASTIAGPGGIAVDGAGTLYVAVPNENRILVFAPNAASGSAAREVLGQVDFTSTRPNPSAFPYASASTFAAPSDVKIDSQGNLFVADTGNNRVVSLPPNSKSAVGVWGQLDFTANGINRIKPGSINSPFKIAVDYSQTPYALYVSDTNNHRVLGWRDAVRFRTGDPADLVIGQPDLSTALPNVDTRGSANPSRTSLLLPRGIALDANGNLYVADGGNHRVLRFPRPVSQSGRIMPDLVIGQADFTGSVSAAVSAFSLRSPSGVAVAPDGNIFVADSGNHRVLEFPNTNSNRPTAIRVFGQPSFTTGVSFSSISAQTLTLPQGIFVDAANTLYVADTGANRVVIFPNTKDSPAIGTAASIVIGQDRFDSFATGSGASAFRGPADVVLDSNGNVYVSDSGNHRVLGFPSLIFLPLAGATAMSVIGQPELAGNTPNWNSADGLATPQGLFSPIGLYMDRRDTLYVGDIGNNRVVHFLKPASVV